MEESLKKPSNFESLCYEDFQDMARDPKLSIYEKIGFPDSYRANYEELIFSDIKNKLTNLDNKNAYILDIGPGCSNLPKYLINHSVARDQELVLIDSQEMLAQLPDHKYVKKISGFYPDCKDQISSWKGKIDAILCYSVLHYIFIETNLWRFIDTSIEMLAPGGQMLIGDIPNISKRKRFFSSSTGIEFHKKFMNTDKAPIVDFITVEKDKIDDSVMMAIIMRVRSQGCDAYWLSQPKDLPMANRREDILIYKP